MLLYHSPLTASIKTKLKVNSDDRGLETVRRTVSTGSAVGTRKKVNSLSNLYIYSNFNARVVVYTDS